ncbi:hypothetical protein [Microbacterium sp. P5_E9]
MQETWTPEVRPEVAPIIATANEIVFAADVEEWLRTRRHVPVTWSPRGNGLLAVRDVAEVAARVGELRDEGQWGLLRRENAARWAQCMRVDGGWIVEVNGIPGPECFARRVQRVAKPRRTLRGPRRVSDKGRLMAIYLPQDVVPTALGVAEIMWSWLRGSVLDGYALRDL